MYCAPAPVITATLARAPNGNAGVFHTLRVMRQLLNAGKVSADVINAAISLIFLVPEKQGQLEVEALFNFVRDFVRYTGDVLGVETLCAPEMTLKRRVGDCDDKALLFATLAECVGYPTRFVVAGYWGSASYEHVYCQVLINGEWWDADATEAAPFGYAPPNPSIIFYEKV